MDNSEAVALVNKGNDQRTGYDSAGPTDMLTFSKKYVLANLRISVISLFFLFLL